MKRKKNQRDGRKRTATTRDFKNLAKVYHENKGVFYRTLLTLSAWKRIKVAFCIVFKSKSCPALNL